jgi:hypothetical protein
MWVAAAGGAAISLHLRSKKGPVRWLAPPPQWTSALFFWGMAIFSAYLSLKIMVKGAYSGDGNNDPVSLFLIWLNVHFGHEAVAIAIAIFGAFFAVAGFLIVRGKPPSKSPNADAPPERRAG